MKVVDVYKQYFKAYCVWNGVERHGVLAVLTATSDAGMIQYKIALTFFPHQTEDDFAVTYDAYVENAVYFAKGRRSKKKEERLMEYFREEADILAKTVQAEIYWDKAFSNVIQ